MNVECEKCGTEYEIDDARISEAAITVKCTHCGHIFRVEPSEGGPFSGGFGSLNEPAAPVDRWRVRRRSGEQLDFDDMNTLRQWIRDGRVTREDEISKTGESWKPIGQFIELAQLFGNEDDPRASVGPPRVSEPPRRSMPSDAPRPPVNRDELLDVSDVRLQGLDQESDLYQPSSMFGRLEIDPSPPPRMSPDQPLGGLSVGPPIAPPPGDGGRGRPASGPPPVVHAPPRRPSARPSMHGHLPPAPPAPPRRPSSPHLPPPAGGPSRPPGTNALRPPPGLRPPPTGGLRPPNTGSVRPPNTGPVRPPMGRASVNRLPPHRDSVPGLGRVDGGPPRHRESVVVGGVRRPSLPGRAPGPPTGPGMPAHRDSNFDMGFEGEAPPRYAAHDGGGAGRGFLMGVLTMIALAGIGYFVYDNYYAPDRTIAETPTPPPTQAAPDVDRALQRAAAAWSRDTEVGLAEAEDAYNEVLRLLGTPPGQPGSAGRAHVGLARVALARAEYARIDGDDARADTQLALADRALAVARTLGQDIPGLELALAELHRLRGEPELAESYLARARTQPELAAEAALITAALRLHTDKPADAAEPLGLLSTEARALPRAAWLRAAALRAAERPAEARGVLEALLAHNPDHEPARRLLATLPGGESDEEVDAAVPDAAPAPTPPKPRPTPPRVEDDDPPEPRAESFDSLMDRGNALLERGKANQARRLFQDAAKQRPRSPEPLASLGWCDLDAGRHQQAIGQFERSLQKNPRYADGMYGLATAYERAGMKQQALNAYQAYLNTHPRGSKAGLVRRKLDQLR